MLEMGEMLLKSVCVECCAVKCLMSNTFHLVFWTGYLHVFIFIWSGATGHV